MKVCTDATAGEIDSSRFFSSYLETMTNKIQQVIGRTYQHYPRSWLPEAILLMIMAVAGIATMQSMKVRYREDVPLDLILPLFLSPRIQQALINDSFNSSNFYPHSLGWLQKKSKWLKQWRKRYFILKGNKIFFSKSATAAPHGMINMVDCMKVEDTGTSGNNKRKYTMKIVLRDVVYSVCADSEEMRNHWIRLIKKAVSEHSSCEEARASITSDSVTPFNNPFASVRV